MEQLARTAAAIESLVWCPWLIVLLLGAGILLTVRTRFVQIRKFCQSWTMLFRGACGVGDDHTRAGDISPYQALSSVLANTVGMGNIAGVATAIHLGGPGALFWMWMTALVGMATIYAETWLSMSFRTTAEDGTMSAGPMYYLARGLKHSKTGITLSFAFALAGGAAALFGDVMIQSNSIAHVFRQSFGVPSVVSGAVIALLAALVTIGGIKRIGAVAEKLVPVMIMIFIGASIVILILKAAELPAAFMAIFHGAFSPTAAAGGFLGCSVMQTIQFGVSRGLYSNEAGWGCSPIYHGAAREDNPERQAVLSMNGVFIDTILICSMTGLVIVATGAWRSGETSTALTAAAFASAIPGGGGIVALSSLLFGLSTVFVGCYYREQILQFLFGIKFARAFRYLYVAWVFLGAVFEVELVWSITLALIGLMAIPNLIGVVLMSGKLAGRDGK